MNRNMMGGMVVLAVIGLLFAGMLAFRHFPQGRTFNIQVEKANGLKVADFVYMKGVRIGEVSKVSLSDSGGVSVSVSIYKTVEMGIPSDSYIYIWPDQFLTGKKCVVIDPGASSELVEAGSTVRGESDFLEIGKYLFSRKLHEIRGD